MSQKNTENLFYFIKSQPFFANIFIHLLRNNHTKAIFNASLKANYLAKLSSALERRGPEVYQVNHNLIF